MNAWLHSILSNINKECKIYSVLFFLKMWCIQTFFEITLSIFAVESLILYTDFFEVELSTNQLILMVLLSIAFAALISATYDIMGFLTFINRISQAANLLKNEDDPEIHLIPIDDYMKKYLKIIHIVALILYIIGAGSLALYILPMVTGTTINLKLRIVIMGAGLLFGLLWSSRAYYTNLRTDWCMIFNKLIDANKDIIYKNTKYSAYIKQLLLNMISLLLFILFFIVIVMNFNDDIINIETFSEYRFYSSTFFFIAYGTLITLCAKSYFLLYYREGTEKIYSSLDKLLSQPVDKKTKNRDRIIKKQENGIFYKWSNDVFKSCTIKNIWFYMKTNIIRAPLEASISLYLAEAWLLFTKDFSINQETMLISDLVYIVFFPLAFSAAVCLVYSLIASIAVMSWVEKIKKDNLKNKDIIEQYFEIDSSFSKRMGLIHILGTLCYFIISLIVAISIMNTFSISYKVVLSLTIMGFFSGLMWNIYGYLSDRRIDWSKIFDFWDEKPMLSNKNIYIWKLRYYKASIISQIINCTLIIGFVIYLLLNLEINFELSEYTLPGFLSCFVIFTLFISVASLYTKQTYKMFFTREYEEAEIFPLLSDFKLIFKMFSSQW